MVGLSVQSTTFLTIAKCSSPYRNPFARNRCVSCARTAARAAWLFKMRSMNIWPNKGSKKDTTIQNTAATRAPATPTRTLLMYLTV